MNEPTSRTQSDESGARPFSRGMGLINQIVGGTFFLVSFCLCCGLSFLIEPEAVSGSTGAGPVLGSTIVLFTTVVGCAGLAAFGLGMQADRGLRPATGAVVTTAAMVAAYGAGLLAPMGGGGSWPTGVAALALGGVSLFMCFFNVIAWSEVYRHRPATTDPPTVRAEDFPDPWAETREKFASPTREAVAKRKRRLEREIEEINRLERNMESESREPKSGDERD